VIEDAPAGIGAARAAGMRSIAIVGTVSPSELEGADVIVDSFRSIRVVISSTFPRLALEC
jgi:sugar-phosphatase